MCTYACLIISMYTQRLYWLAALGFTSGHSTLHPDAGYRAMFGDGSELGGGAQQQQRGAPETFGIGATEHMTVPIVEVAFGYGKWWSIPQEMSAQMINTSTARMQGTHGIGEKADVLDPGSRMVRKPASTATSLTSPHAPKQISTTDANAPFESYGYALKMWCRNSQVNCQRPLAEQ